MRTDIVMVLDRSGSMDGIAADTVGGVNRFLAEQQKVPEPATFTLVQFDHEYVVLCQAMPIAAVAPLVVGSTYVPRGTTALLDAIGRTIDDTGARLAALPEAERPGAVVFVIVTDGYENASRVFTSAQVHARITHQRDVYKWNFVFLGANQDAIASAATLNVPAAQALTFAANAIGTRAAYRSVSANVASMRVQHTNTMTAFSPEDRAEALSEE